MTTPTLTEFLLARIDDDEDLVMEGDWPFPGSGERGFEARCRMLAECAAKRWVIDDLELAELLESRPANHYKAAASYVTNSLRRVAMHLALPYADHPDFRSEWRL